MRPMLNIAIRIIREIGNIIIKNYEIQTTNILNKKINIDIFIEKINKSIKNIILQKFSDIYSKKIIIFNKKGIFIIQYKKTKWIINPLDGIINFINKLPHFATSIAICIKGKTEISLIYDPLKNDLFTAIRGQDAQLNGYRLRINHYLNSKMLLALNKNFISENNININLIKLFINNLISFRISGSLSLDLAYLAANRINCYISNNITNFDKFIAGELIIKESGGLITDFLGNCNYKYSKNILAGNSTIIKFIISEMKKY
ncbi:inositol monophosphatase family protein [Enterobacteriaceae endosymbiont of Plateumaris braccata]|uniref:inositol monophosphatase family protein n=1 Tax=Enterobacteriaceae endosymbiont of Plateumaris braccata TaxID=2675793 RepID=UPI001449E2A1|nr:inositol monophosphatase family protein [Enterobacteriaceae endosymbiont of Plateumaris braccata]QJC28179.1 inositol monophosphatase [Enterobacteriaceae endosymbiont of Plateumaris braccata]